ncbi:MAG: hypothetical protein ACOX5J_00605 [Candidatus Hydrogenedentales bacterium]|jgi:hypothetical protein
MDKGLAAIIAGIVFLAILPLVCHVTKEPIPITVDDIKAAFRERNFSIANERAVSRPRYQADAEIFMTINGAQVSLFTYSNVTVIDREISTMETEARRLPAAQGSADAVEAVRNKHFVLLIVSNNLELRERISSLFVSLRNPGPPPPPPPEDPVLHRRF